MIRNVKRRVIHLDPLRCHAFLVPHVGDFRRRALFDANVGAGRGGEVYGGGGGADVEGDAVVFGEDGDTGGADLVGNVAVGGDAVAADEYSMDPAVLHDG